jgi:hypothetical protein
MGNITFTLGEGGLGRVLPGEDHISGIIFQNASLPAGFGSSDRIKRVTSLAEAEALGITFALFPPEWYHVSEFFRANPKGILYIGIYAITANAFNGDQIILVQNYAQGKIRQMGVFLIDTFAVADLTDCDTKADTCAAANKPLSVLLAADFSATTVSALIGGTLPRSLTAQRASVVLSEDLGGVGGALAISEGYSITTLGHTLGTLSAAKVHENIGWIGKFNASDGTECETVGFATGEAVSVQTEATLTSLTNGGFIFLRNVVGKSGSFYNDAPTAVVATSDYAYIENQRTIDKAIRGVYASVLDLVNSPLYVDADTGKLSESTIAVFRNTALVPLESMAANGEISAKADGELPDTTVTIDPDQNVLSTSTITMTIRLVPVGVARTIAINIGFSVNVN